MKRLTPAILLIILVLSGCASISYIEKIDGRYQVRALSDLEKSGDISQRDIFPPYNTKPISSRAKFFLVAASSDTANFLQEIVEQRQILMSMGYHPDEIVCYYVAPTRHEFLEDQDQFKSLIGKVEAFYLASTPNLFSHLTRAGDNDPPFVYLYVTSHGSPPLGETLREYYGGMNQEPQRQIDFLTGRFPDYYNQYFISFDAMTTGKANAPMRLHAMAKAQSPEDLILTPKYLNRVLSGVREEVKKYVILQGCYTGSFISTNHEGNAGQDSLKNIPNICVMTASRWDRPSFGCAPGPDRTYFGGTFNDLLSTQRPPLEAIVWQDFYEKLKIRIKRMESDQQIDTHSLPAYFNNIGA